jgi:hypothetical protein
MADESYSPKRDSEECQVWCLSCNAYLYSVSVYEPIARGQCGRSHRIGTIPESAYSMRPSVCLTH